MLPFLTSSSPRCSCDRGIGLVGLGARELGLTLLDHRLVGILLDHEQEIAGLDVGALLEQPLLEEPGDAGAQLHLVDRDDPAVEADARRDLGRLHGDHGHRRRRRPSLRSPRSRSSARSPKASSQRQAPAATPGNRARSENPECGSRHVSNSRGARRGASADRSLRRHRASCRRRAHHLRNMPTSPGTPPGKSRIWARTL